MRERIVSIGRLKGCVVEDVHYDYDGRMALLFDSSRYAIFSMVPHWDDAFTGMVELDTYPKTAAELLDLCVISDAEYDELAAQEEVEDQQATWEKDRKELARLTALYPQGVPDEA